MTHAIAPTLSEANIATLAKEAETSTDVVKAIHDEAVAALSEHAKIQQFVGVIATRLVCQRLRWLSSSH